MAAAGTVSAVDDHQSPTDLEAAARLLRDTAGERVRILISGAGSKLGWAGPVDSPDLEISTAGLDQLIDYRPGDMTVAVQAGMPLDALQPVLAEHGQWLAIDPPTQAAGATIGGLLVSGDAGPCRLRHGTLRDLSIGCTLVLADGTIARAGGHVIKNVAGYDLTKLMHGSLGTLALVVEVVLRLNPLPAASRTILCKLDATGGIRATAAVIGSGVEPSAVEWSGTPSGTGNLLVRLDGTARTIEALSDHAVRALRDSGAHNPEIVSEAPSTPSGISGPELVAGQPAPATVCLGTLPDQLPMIAEKIDKLADRHQVAVSMISSTGLGLHTARLSGPIAAQAAMVDELGAVVQHLGGSLALRDRDPELDRVRGTSAPMPEQPPAAALQRAVKDRFDPDHRLAPGRFAPWF
ncbi:FAD-linked oxidase [Microlunatus endophyticus]|uniref:FAD-linked oxidase n=1 Tax=Microlunatus endophyticus TaxID=1716077 RepID=A0A917SDK9_9ACTN|nr:FAD-binding oxidoreductase [Microlunatus endophyticus]GGL72584.1 FAD-linked oxidase [Microlunatus endophyticus]